MLFLHAFYKVQMVHSYSSSYTNKRGKISFLFHQRLDFHMINDLSIALHGFPTCMLTSLLVDEILLQRYMNCSTKSGLPLKVEMTPSCLKLMNPVLFAFTKWSMFPAACSSLCAGIRLGQVYLRLVLDRLCSLRNLHLSLFLRDIFYWSWRRCEQTSSYHSPN